VRGAKGRKKSHNPKHQKTERAPLSAVEQGVSQQKKNTAKEQEILGEKVVEGGKTELYFEACV